MADPLSISASVLAVVTAAIQSAKSLHETVKSFQNRDTTLHRLQNEVADVVNILDALKEAIDADSSMPPLLQGPVDRCCQLCRDFEHSMRDFRGKSKSTFLDWAKMEFMRGDINEFIDTLAGYKSTITVGVGLVTMRTAKLSRQVLEEYDEMIKNTAYNLEIRLLRIDDKVTSLTTDISITSDSGIDLRSEREVTEQCLRICEDARSYIDTLTGRDPSLLQQQQQQQQQQQPPQQQEVSVDGAKSLRDAFEAQLLTGQVLGENRDRIVELIGRLRERLESILLDGDTCGRLQLLEDINTSKQCLELCNMASSQVSQQKIHIIGEVVADGDSDQVVVTTLADLFDVKKATSKGRSAQLIGSMADDTLRQLSVDRYSSRFGALSGDLGSSHGETATVSSDFDRVKANPTPPSKNRPPPSPGAPRKWPAPNETRRRMD